MHPRRLCRQVKFLKLLRALRIIPDPPNPLPAAYLMHLMSRQVLHLQLKCFLLPPLEVNLKPIVSAFSCLHAEILLSFTQQFKRPCVAVHIAASTDPRGFVSWLDPAGFQSN